MGAADGWVLLMVGCCRDASCFSILEECGAVAVLGNLLTASEQLMEVRQAHSLWAAVLLLAGVYRSFGQTSKHQERLAYHVD